MIDSISLIKINIDMSTTLEELALEKGIPLNPNIFSESIETQQLIYKYINEMTDIQCQAYLIAFYHLKSSFDLVKTNGFNHFLEKQKKK